MAWCRWSDSDLYVFETQDDFVCMCCPFSKPHKVTGMRGDFTCRTEREMNEHVLKHADAGHDVPDELLEIIRKEMEAPESSRAQEGQEP